jgi:hypothetical protein
VQKYLAQVDAQSSASGAGGGNAYVLQLLQPGGAGNVIIPTTNINVSA